MSISYRSVDKNFFFSLLIACTSCTSEENQAPNYILLIGDDMAVETLDCYDIGSETAHTPNLNELCGMSVRFDNFWSQPVCSPTRASLLTGQYGFENGVGSPTQGMNNVDWNIPGAETSDNNNTGNRGRNRVEQVEPPRPGLKADAYTFVNALDSAGYQTAAVGKWHLADDKNGGFQHPLNVGFDHYAGSMRTGGVASFYGWSKIIDGGEPFGKTGYATTDIIDDGLAWLDRIEKDEPFLLWVAFNAPHTPFHKPPKELLSSDVKNLDPNNIENDRHAYYNAAIEAMDTEIGRLLSSLDKETRNNTYVIFMGDNGTPNQVVTSPFRSGNAKGSVFQGGVQVPFIIDGPGIQGGQTSPALAHAVDLFDTFLDLSGVTPEKDSATHSVSLKPVLLDDVNTQVREHVYADMFGSAGGSPTDRRAIRNSEYKLIEDRLHEQEFFFHLPSDPYENNNLLDGSLNPEQKTQYDSLKIEIASLTGE